MHQATLRLFNGIQTDGVGKYSPPLERTIKNGYLLSSALKPDEEMLSIIESVVGISGEKANSAFHKSWATIQDASMEQLVVQQIVHYITTYGFERLGIYNEETVYIPHEALELPAIEENIPLVFIKAMSADEILAGILLLASGIALSQQVLDDIMAIIRHNGYDSSFVPQVGNRELKALLYEHYDVTPNEPEEYLRYLINKLTGESLLIKNNALIEKIKKSDSKSLDHLLKNAPENLASIFFRFKPLFLAMKSASSNKTFFNKLRKQATKQHKPLPADYLNSITEQIKQGRLELSALEQRLTQASIYRKIRLAYALKRRLAPADSILYQVRNGRGWVTDFEWSTKYGAITQQALDVVLASISDHIKPNVEDKAIYIPSHVHYALPATEKQFTGHLPTGSYVSVPHDVIVGIHWTNTNKRVDLDLSVIGTSGKIGWDAAYRSTDMKVLFSGDITDAPAPNGATELFYFKQGVQEPRILFTNYFNFTKGDEVETKILVAQEKPENFGQNYVVDINHIVAAAVTTISKKQNVLGLIVNVEGENRVYFANVSIGKSITSGQNQQSTMVREYFTNSLINGGLYLDQILKSAGANIVRDRPSTEYIDLSPQALNKTTMIDLL